MLMDLGSTLLVEVPCNDVNSIRILALLLVSCKCPRARLALASGGMYMAVTMTTVNSRGRYMGLHFTVTNSRSEEQRLLTVLVFVHQLVVYIIALLCFNQTSLSCCAGVQPSSSIDSSGIDERSHVSVNSRMQLFLAMLFVATRSFSLSTLLARDLTLARKMLGSGGLCGRLRRLASAPTLQPRFCLLSLRRLPVGMVNHEEPGYLATSTGMPLKWRNSAVTGR